MCRPKINDVSQIAAEISSYFVAFKDLTPISSNLLLVVLK